MKLIGQGNTAEIYEFEEGKIIKLFRPGIPITIIQEEFERAKFVESIISNTPRTYDLITLEKRTGIVYSKLTGKDMIKQMLISVFQLNSYSKKLAHYHSALHENQTHSELFPLQQKLFNDIEATSLLDSDVKEKIKKYIEALPSGNSLCHFDFHPGNIILDKNEYWIIDWMTTSVGNKYADVARTYTILNYGELPHKGRLINRIVSLFQKHIAKIYLSEYLNITNSGMSDIEPWILPIAAARLREWVSPNEEKVLLKLIRQKLEGI